MKEIDKTVDYVNQRGLSRTGLFNAVGASLARLEMDYVDLLQIHRYDATVPVKETMKALHDLVVSGKVRYIGASSMWTYQFAEMQYVAERNGWTKFVSMQNYYNLLYREEEREMNSFCKETGVGLIPVSLSFITALFLKRLLEKATAGRLLDNQQGGMLLVKAINNLCGNANQMVCVSSGALFPKANSPAHTT